MYSEERQQAIVRLAREHGRVSVNETAETFGVAVETIRRDLSALERNGVVRRVHGGAIPVGPLGFEADLAARARTMPAEKQRIAKAAIAELPADGAVFIEAGNTCAHLTDLLPTDRQLTVITNGGYLAMALAARPNLTVLVVGGRVRHLTLASVDDWALQTLAGICVDVAFVGTNGLSVERGLTTPDPAEAAVKRAILGVGRRTVLLADHTKFGAVSPCRYGDVADVDLIITDSGLGDEDAAELATAGALVVRA